MEPRDPGQAPPLPGCLGDGGGVLRWRRGCQRLCSRLSDKARRRAKTITSCWSPVLRQVRAAGSPRLLTPDAAAGREALLRPPLASSTEARPGPSGLCLGCGAPPHLCAGRREGKPRPERPERPEEEPALLHRPSGDGEWCPRLGAARPAGPRAPPPHRGVPTWPSPAVPVERVRGRVSAEPPGPHPPGPRPHDDAPEWSGRGPAPLWGGGARVHPGAHAARPSPRGTWHVLVGVRRLALGCIPHQDPQDPLSQGASGFISVGYLEAPLKEKI